MTYEIRRDLTAQDYVRKLFADTKDGELAITYYPYNMEQPYTMHYKMDWTREDAEEIVRRYDVLTAALLKFGQLHNELFDEEKRKKLLDEEENEIWETYLRPFPDFEVSDEVIGELYLRAEYDSLEEEENELLERHYRWRQHNSLQRLPFLRRSPADLILRAMRYEKLVNLGAPEVVITEEGRCLAEEMVLYYHGPQENAEAE